jgi:hypothetical protein
MLQDAVDQQERLADDGHAFAVEQIGADDDVRGAGLVLEREKERRSLWRAAGPVRRSQVVDAFRLAATINASVIMFAAS